MIVINSDCNQWIHYIQYILNWCKSVNVIIVTININAVILFIYEHLLLLDVRQLDRYDPYWNSHYDKVTNGLTPKIFDEKFYRYFYLCTISTGFSTLSITFLVVLPSKLLVNE